MQIYISLNIGRVMCEVKFRVKPFENGDFILSARRIKPVYNLQPIYCRMKYI